MVKAIDPAKDPEQDPRIHRQIIDEYVHADRLRAAILAGVFFTGGGLLSLLWVVTLLKGVPPEPWQQRGLLIGAATGLSLGCLECLLRSQAQRVRGGASRILLWYGATGLEVIVITAAWAVLGSRSVSSSLLSPGIAGFASLTVLSALRLDWRVTSFTGFLSAVASAALLLIFRDDLASTGHSTRILWTVSPLVTIGILAALVAEKARRRTFHAIKAVAVQQRLERELTSTAEAERQRIGRDLHDGLGSRLQGLALMAEGIARRVQNSQAVEADELRELAELLGEGVDEVRRLSRGLDPAPVETGLCRALQTLAERTESAGIDCTFLVEGDERPVSRDATVHLYHIAQEAVTNAIRHGSAGRVDIRLTIRTGTIALDIRDDGSGIPDDPADGQGLRAMGRRAALLDAALRIRRGPTGGTLVSCVVPRTPEPTAPGAA